MHYPPRPFLPLHTRLRASGGGLPVIGLGRIESAEAAETALAEGACDLGRLQPPVDIGRRLAAQDRGRPRRRRPRLHLLQLLLGRDSRVASPSAASRIPCWRARTRPTGGRHWPKSPSAWWWWAPGSPGLEAAWIAAVRGHAVTVFSASAEPGGAAPHRGPPARPGGGWPRLPLSSAERRRRPAPSSASGRDRHRSGGDGVRARRGDPRHGLADALAAGARRGRRGGRPEASRRRSLGRSRHPRPRRARRCCSTWTRRPPSTAPWSCWRSASPRVVLLTTRRRRTPAFVNLMSRMGVERRLALLGIDVRRLTEPVARARATASPAATS